MLEMMKSENKKYVERSKKISGGKFYSKLFGNNELQQTEGRIRQLLDIIKKTNDILFDVIEENDIRPTEKIVKCDELHCEGEACYYRQYYDEHMAKRIKQYEEGLGEARRLSRESKP
jgi:hypothetical protein